MRVSLIPIDEKGCGSYRMIWPAGVCETAGDAETTFLRSIPIRRRKRGWDIVDARVDADVIVLQRPTHREVLSAIPHLQRNGTAVVVDLDDDLAAPDSRAPTFEDLHPKLHPDENWHHLKRACQLADLVTVTTPALAQRYGGAKARVIPNCVPASLLAIAADRDGRTVGWGGSTITHVDDLTATQGGVAQAIADTNARFLLVGWEQDVAQRQLGLPALPDTSGPVAFDEYPAAVAQFDVGIVPLRQTVFNAAKSCLKGLEYAALGVPFVASPTADYQRIHDEGIGLVAGRGREWRRQVRQLLTDEAFRSEIAARARERVAEQHLYETNAWRWTEAWEEAIAIRRKRRAVAA